MSENGLMVTALHCLENCLRFSGEKSARPVKTDSVEVNSKTELKNSFMVHRLLKEKLQNFICDIDSEQVEIETNLSAQVIFTPAEGWIDSVDIDYISKTDNLLFQKLRNEKIAGVADDLDFALVKIF